MKLTEDEADEYLWNEYQKGHIMKRTYNWLIKWTENICAEIQDVCVLKKNYSLLAVRQGGIFRQADFRCSLQCVAVLPQVSEIY